MVLGIELNLSGGEIFCTHPDKPWGPPSLIYNGSWVCIPGTKQPGYGTVHLLRSSAEVKERSRNIPLLPLWAFVTCCRVNCSFIFYLFHSGDYARNMHVNMDVWGDHPPYWQPCILAFPFSIGQLQKPKEESIVLITSKQKNCKICPWSHLVSLCMHIDMIVYRVC